MGSFILLVPYVAFPLYGTTHAIKKADRPAALTSPRAVMCSKWEWSKVIIQDASLPVMSNNNNNQHTAAKGSSQHPHA